MKLFALLSEYARINRDNVAFIDDARSVTYGHLWQLIQGNRCYLIEKGFQNQAIAYKIGSQMKFAIDFLCLAAAGCWVIPISSDVSEDTYKNLMAAYGISLEIDSSFLPSNSLDQAYEPFDQDESSCGIYHLTSGSTGEPKLCVRNLTALKEEGFSYQRLFTLRDAAKITSLSPIYHSFAFGAAYMTALVSGSSVYLLDKFIPRKAVDIIGTWQANIVIAVPVMIKAVATVLLPKKYDFSKLSIVLVGTGNVPTETKSIFRERFGVFISANYGSTETGGLLSRITENPADSIGKEMEGIELRLIRQDGSEAKIGEEGEACVKCKYMMRSYLNGGAEVFDRDGFFPMGDIMIKDADGFYYVKGRVKNLINVGGKKVNPKEVEDVLLRYPGIRDCVVCKAIRTNDQEIVKAIIAGKCLNATNIRQYLHKELADYKIPSLIEFVDNIERNMLGKYVKQGVL
ncbi:MAG: long-chain fatty acid--CoA ligase [Dorea sp.]|jgi:long-chain acyl-CoA synthetase|nr:long-chain fatty acid--CoA ligase [Clostridiales bacterium]MCI9271501.1 long-chain fatty acid--CoA ligase [Dorea sp.]